MPYKNSFIKIAVQNSQFAKSSLSKNLVLKVWPYEKLRKDSDALFSSMRSRAPFAKSEKESNAQNVQSCTFSEVVEDKIIEQLADRAAVS